MSAPVFERRYQASNGGTVRSAAVGNRCEFSMLERQRLVSTSSSTSCLTSISRDSDVVKRGCLYVKRPPSNSAVKLRIKAWQKRYLVLRDTWTPEGDTTLELYSADPTSPLTSRANERMTSAISTSSINSLTSAVSALDVVQLPTPVRRRRPGLLAGLHRDQYVISLRTVTHVDVYRDSKGFPYAFIVLRKEKDPLIFGARSELEMKEWMMAIKLLADKLRPAAAAGSVRSHTASSSPAVEELINESPSSKLLAGNRFKRRLQQQATVTTMSSSSTESSPAVVPRRMSQPLAPFSITAHQNDLFRRSTPLLMTSSGTTSAGVSGQVEFQERPTTSRKAASSVRTVERTERLFPVRIHQYSDVNLSDRLQGDYILAVGSAEISLCQRRPLSNGGDVSLSAGDVIVQWQLCDIRKLKCETAIGGNSLRDVITLVTMSESASQDGATYLFRTNRGPDLIRCVRQKVRELDLLQAGTASQDDFSTAGITKIGSGELQKSSANSPVSRSEPDLLSSSSFDDVITTNCGGNSNHLGNAPQAEDAFYLPLVDGNDDDDDDENVDKTVESMKEMSPNSTTLTNAFNAEGTCRQVLSKSTGALNVITIHSIKTELQSTSVNVTSADLRKHLGGGGAPVPPPRPAYTMSAFDVCR